MSAKRPKVSRLKSLNFAEPVRLMPVALASVKPPPAKQARQRGPGEEPQVGPVEDPLVSVFPLAAEHQVDHRAVVADVGHRGHHAAAGSDQRPQRRQQLLRLQHVLEHVVQHDAVEALARQLRQHRRRVPHQHPVQVPCGQGGRLRIQLDAPDRQAGPGRLQARGEGAGAAAHVQHPARLRRHEGLHLPARTTVVGGFLHGMLPVHGLVSPGNAPGFRSIIRRCRSRVSPTMIRPSPSCSGRSGSGMVLAGPPSRVRVLTASTEIP